MWSWNCVATQFRILGKTLIHYVIFSFFVWYLWRWKMDPSFHDHQAHIFLTLHIKSNLLLKNKIPNIDWLYLLKFELFAQFASYPKEQITWCAMNYLRLVGLSFLLSFVKSFKWLMLCLEILFFGRVKAKCWLSHAKSKLGVIYPTSMVQLTKFILRYSCLSNLL